MSLATARALLIQEAMRTSNNNLLRHLLAEQKDKARVAKDSATPDYAILQERAQEVREQQAKRRKEVKEENRLAANEEEERKRATARAQTEASEARLACLRQVLENNREAAKRRAAAARAKSIARWLQTEYPIDRAEKMIAWYTGIRQVDRERYTKEVREMLVTGF